MTSSSEREAPGVGDGIEDSFSGEAPDAEEARTPPIAEAREIEDGLNTEEWTGDNSTSTPSPFSPGQVVGDRCRVRAALGRGGMGEVWQAFDLKLRVQVALKSLRKELFADERGLELLRREVLSAREVVSPNVCRVFDLQVADDQELVSMEYIDGRTLLGELSERGPLELAEAGKIASQLLAGLAAIHDAGLVHRDLKPENVMITRAGRVVIMDFGIAKAMAEASTGTVAGTPAYMAPEQQRGEAVDARTDVFATGVMLAEMVGPEGIGNLETRRQLWAALRKQPPQVPEGPWEVVIRRAVAADPEDRYRSAWALARALEEVTLRVEGAEDMRPYPGLASFTEADAEFFFGREAEVEALWKKLQRPHLLGLIGPSGAGKSSFLHAGLIPVRPEDWCYVTCQPGDAPFRALAQALVPELSGDTEAVADLVRFDDVEAAVRVIARWRAGAREALLVVDQFEELFTLNPPATQRRFSDLLGRLPVEADVRVLLSMRDDFLFRCHEQPALAPLFSELTPLGAPSGAALRRALVQPALACGYRFEDEALVEEMVGEVTEERGALPLLAFAASRLWEKRDRETGMLTRSAYEEIGGAGGALAQHAETTLERLGAARRDQVREVFRNLVTAEGTRASCEIDELLSVFDDPAAAREVIDALIDARLLTSYEVPGSAGETESHRVEIVHESLLAAWPRLVRWQTQDADGAQLRDQLRQTARIWEERERPDDLLWTGSAWRELELWSERYPGGLSDSEEAFVSAVRRQAQRRRRWVRVAVASIFVALLVVLATFSGLWQRSEVALGRSEEALRRSEASKLLALGRLRLEDYPTATLAYALASLELVDDPVVRQLALEALWEGPTAFLIDEDSTWQAHFSPDGEWLAQLRSDLLRFWSLRGESHTGSDAPAAVFSGTFATFTPSSDVFVTLNVNPDKTRSLRGWSVPEGTTVFHRTEPIGARAILGPAVGQRTLYGTTQEGVVSIHSVPFDGGEVEDLGRLEPSQELIVETLGSTGAFEPAGNRLAAADGSSLFVYLVDELDEGPQLVGSHEEDIVSFAFHPKEPILASLDEGGEIRIWSLDSGDSTPLQILRARANSRWLRFSPAGRLLAVDRGAEIDLYRNPLPADGTPIGTIEPRSGFHLPVSFDANEQWLANSQWDPTVFLWQLDGPVDAEPIVLRRGAVFQVNAVAFHPEGEWLATGDQRGLLAWPLGRSYARILRVEDQVNDVVFAADGSWFAAGARTGKLHFWPLEGGLAGPSRILFDRAALGQELKPSILGLDLDPEGRFLLAGGYGDVYLVPIDSGAPRALRGFAVQAWNVAFSHDGRLACAGGSFGKSESVIRVWEVESGAEVAVLDAGDQRAIGIALFTRDGDILSSGGELRRWDVEEETFEMLVEGTAYPETLFDDGRQLLYVTTDDDLVLYELATGASRSLSGFGSDLTAVTIDESGTVVVTGDADGVVRVGPTTGAPPHLLLGHKGLIRGVDIDPAGRFIASASDDATVRLWPIPKGRPLHTLQYEELLDRLRSLTNLRVVADETSSTGYRLEAGPFPGWERVPTW